MSSNSRSNNFKFLTKEYPLLANLCQSAEYHLYTDPKVSLFKLRLFGEKVTELLFGIHFLERPYNDTLHNRIQTLKHESIFPDQLASVLFTIKQRGNTAIHDNKGTTNDATTALLSKIPN